MSLARSNYTWIAICLASILICLKIEASPLTALARPLSQESSLSADLSSFNFNIEDEADIEPIPKNIVARSPDSDDNSVDEEEDENKDKDEKTEKPHSDSDDENKNHHTSHHAHGSHGALGGVKHLLNSVRDRFHGNGAGPLGGLGAMGTILTTHAHPSHPAHESPIETEHDRTMINSSTGLHVLEFLGTIGSLLMGLLSNLPALFGSSSGGAGGGQ